MIQPTHLSYSSLSSYKSCPRSYYLSRVKRAEPVPAWYFIVGTSVHTCIESSLNGDDFDIEQAFYSEVERAMLVDPDVSVWLHGGGKDEPVVEDRALGLARSCLGSALEFLEDVEVWAVEYDLTGHLPGVSLPIKAFPDLVGEHKKHGPVIIDWKTGKSRGDKLQLETYNALSQVSDNPFLLDVPFKGWFQMLNPAAQKARPFKFKETVSSMAKMYAEVEASILKGVYPAIPQFNCGFCTMKPNCKLMSGSTPRTRYYDTPEKDGGYPF